MDDDAVIHPCRKIGAAGKPQSHPVAGDARAVRLRGRRLIATNVSEIEKCERAGACAAYPRLTTEVGGVDLGTAAVAPIVRDLAFEKTAHGIHASDSKLLTRYEHISRLLTVRPHARLPIAGKRAVVVHRPAPNFVEGIGAFANAIVAR